MEKMPNQYKQNASVRNDFTQNFLHRLDVILPVKNQTELKLRIVAKAGHPPNKRRLFIGF